MSNLKSMRLDLVRCDLSTLQVPPRWTEADGHRPWPAKLVAPAVDTSVVLPALVLIGMFAFWVQVITVNLREAAYFSLAFNVLVLGTVIVRYAGRLWTIRRLSS